MDIAEDELPIKIDLCFDSWPKDGERFALVPVSVAQSERFKLRLAMGLCKEPVMPQAE